eukprot:EG_transcript_10027
MPPAFSAAVLLAASLLVTHPQPTHTALAEHLAASISLEDGTSPPDILPEAQLYAPQAASHPWRTCQFMAPAWPAGDRVAAVVAGAFHTVALVGRHLYAVGSNAHGQLGDNTTTDRPTFVRVIAGWDSSTPVTALAAGDSHTVVLAGGRPFAVGDNYHGQLGDGTTVARFAFVLMLLPGGGQGTATAAAAGTFHTVVLAGGEVFATGGNTLGQLGDGALSRRLTLGRVVPAWGRAAVTAVAAGNAHTVVLAGGRVFAAGANWHGELGDGTQIVRTAFVPVKPMWDPTMPVTAIAAGGGHTVLLAGNDLYAAGSNVHGQLGVDPAERQRASTFVRMAVTWDREAAVTSVAAGDLHTIVVAGGVPYAVGYNGDGQLGDNTTVGRAAFVPLRGPRPVTAVAAGCTHTVVLAGMQRDQ